MLDQTSHTLLQIFGRACEDQGRAREQAVEKNLESRESGHVVELSPAVMPARFRIRLRGTRQGMKCVCDELGTRGGPGGRYYPLRGATRLSLIRLARRNIIPREDRAFDRFGQRFWNRVHQKNIGLKMIEEVRRPSDVGSR